MDQYKTIYKHDIPKYLENSQLYFNYNDEDSFEVPLKNYKPNNRVNNINDFKYLIETINYWNVYNCDFDYNTYYWIMTNIDIVKQIIQNDYPIINFDNESPLKFVFDDEYDKVIKEISDVYQKIYNVKMVLPKIKILKLSDIFLMIKYDMKIIYKMNFCKSIKNIAIMFGIYTKNNNYLSKICVIKDKINYRLICAYGGLKGYIHVLEFYKERRNKLYDNEICANVALGGYIDCLKWLHNNLYEWNENTCINSVKNDNLDCLEYAHLNGCRWNYNTFLNAQQNNSAKCLEYLISNNCPQIPLFSQFNIYDSNYNILRIMSGMAGLAFNT